MLAAPSHRMRALGPAAGRITPGRLAICRATTATAKTVLTSLNCTVSKLDAEGGSTTRNIDGTIYRITKKGEAIEVIDPSKGVSYAVTVDPKTTQIRIDTSAAVGSVATPGLGAYGGGLGAVLAGNQLGAELVNGRAAMVGILACGAVEAATGAPFLAQLASPAGAAAGLVVGAAVLAASVAPAVAGKVPAGRVFPDENDAYPDRQLPTYFNALAEKINARVAMLAFAVHLVQGALGGQS